MKEECIKHKYLDEATAELQRHEINRRNKIRNRKKRLKRSYPCHICGFWHVSSKDFRTIKQLRKGSKKK